VTLHATHDRANGLVTVHVTHGPVSVQVTETEGHALSFFHQLGQVVAAEDNEARAKAGWGRYSANHPEGDMPMPRWEDLSPEERGHWTAAFTE
jgi:hypothetical protein